MIKLLAPVPAKDPLMQRLAQAKWAVMQADGFIGFLANELPTEIVPADHHIDTAATDYRRFYYNEKWCDGLTGPELIFVVIHECLHVLLAHGRRRSDRVHELFNIAADHVINLMIQASFGPRSKNPIAAMPLDRSLSPPQPIGCMDAAFTDLTSEEVYDKLMGEVRKLGVPVDAFLSAIAGKGNAGDILTNVPQEVQNRLRSFDPSSAPSGEDVQQDQRAAIAAAVARALTRAVSHRHSRGQGSEPSEFERLAEAGFEAQTPWERFLRAKLSRIGVDNIDWSRPAKKYLGIRHNHHGIYLPRRTGLSFGHVAVILDSSGSVVTDALGQFIAEVNALLQRGDITVHVFVCDAAVHKLGVFTPTRRLPSSLALPGGGGTDFRPAFDAALELNRRLRLSAIVYLTDTYGTFPDKEPPCPTIWVIPEEPGQTVPFGEAVHVNITKVVVK